MSVATQLTEDIYRHQNGLKQINIVNNDGFSALFVVNTPVVDNSGIAHAVEHLVFRASAAFPQSESLFQLTSLTDVKINASTCADTTYFHCQSQCSQSFMLAINYLLNGLFNPAFHSDDVNYEIHDGNNQGVIFRELIGTEHKNKQTLKKIDQPALCYGGISSLIGKLSLSDLINYHQQFYHVNNITLVTANADIEELSNLISLLPKQKDQLPVDLNNHGKSAQNDEDKNHHQKKFSDEINQLIAIYHQWLQDPYYQEIDDYIEVENTKQSLVADTDTLQTAPGCHLILPLVALSNTLKKELCNYQNINASVQKSTSERSLPNLFTDLYQQIQNQLTQQLTKQKSNKNGHYANDQHNALWLTDISINEQKLANIASYIISAYPDFLAPRSQGLCYAIQALTIENSTCFAMYSAFDVNPHARLRDISPCLLKLSQDISFISMSLVLAKIKYCRTYQLNINQVTNITSTDISTYLQTLTVKQFPS